MVRSRRLQCIGVHAAGLSGCRRSVEYRLSHPSGSRHWLVLAEAAKPLLSASTSIAIGGLREDRHNLTMEGRQLAFHDAPNRLIRDGSVAVDEAVPECNDARRLRDSTGKRRIQNHGAVERLADDLKLTLDWTAGRSMALAR